MEQPGRHRKNAPRLSIWALAFDFYTSWAYTMCLFENDLIRLWGFLGRTGVPNPKVVAEQVLWTLDQGG